MMTAIISHMVIFMTTHIAPTITHLRSNFKFSQKAVLFERKVDFI
jgi:hypothetical protein